MLLLTAAIGIYVVREAPPILASQGHNIADALNAAWEAGVPPSSVYPYPPVEYESMYDKKVKAFNVDDMYGRKR